MSIRESTIERTVCAWTKERGILVIKISGPSQKGVPDRLFLRGGKTAFVEFKRPGGKTTALQDMWLARLSAEGFPAEAFDNVGNAIQWLKGVFGE